MKYSQAIIVAVVGGAALAAAAPTIAPAPAAEVAKTAEVVTPVAGTNPHHKTQHHHTDETNRDATTGAGTHRKQVKKATANNVVAKPGKTTTEAATKPVGAKHRKTKAEKKAAEKAAEAAGTTTPAARDVEEFFERSFSEELATRDLTEGFELYERSEGEGLEVRMFENLWRAFTPHQQSAEHAKLGQAGHKHTGHKEAEPVAAVSSTTHADHKTSTHATTPAAPVTAPSTEAPEAAGQAPLAARNIMDDDELVARYFDELEARGLWSRVKGIFHKKTPTAPVDQGNESRDLEEDDLLARFEDEIEARGLWSRVKGIFHKKTPAAVDSGNESRDFDEDLFERDFDEELFERDFIEDLELRGLWSRVKGIFHKKTPAAAVDTGNERRDFDEDLFERDLYDEEDLFGRDFYDEEDLMAREVDVLDALEAVKKTFTPKHARDLFDELDARDFADWELEALD